MMVVMTPELNAAIGEYRRIFGEDFPATYVGYTTEGRIARIKECIATNTPVPESEYAEQRNAYLSQFK